MSSVPSQPEATGLGGGPLPAGARAAQVAPFICQRCGACCRVDGYVRLTDADIDALAAAKGTNVHSFTEQFTRVTRDRGALALTDQSGGACIFLTDVGCAVEASKPQQCRDFPESWRYKNTAAVCPAVQELGTL